MRKPTYRVVNCHRRPDPIKFRSLDRAFAACSRREGDGWLVVDTWAIYAAAVAADGAWSDEDIYLLEDLGL